MKPLVISNLDIGDITFENDRASWNVTRAQKDCDAGKHGHVWRFPVGDVLPNNVMVEVDVDKVGRFMTMPDVLAKPGIFVMDGGALWYIEGHHRLRALALLGAPDLWAYVIETDVNRYRVTYNGQALPPWQQQTQQKGDRR